MEFTLNEVEVFAMTTYINVNALRCTEYFDMCYVEPVEMINVTPVEAAFRPKQS